MYLFFSSFSFSLSSSFFFSFLRTVQPDHPRESSVFTSRFAAIRYRYREILKSRVEFPRNFHAAWLQLANIRGRMGWPHSQWPPSNTRLPKTFSSHPIKSSSRKMTEKGRARKVGGDKISYEIWFSRPSIIADSRERRKRATASCIHYTFNDFFGHPRRRVARVCIPKGHRRPISQLLLHAIAYYSLSR